jgi:hypothetical protein
MSYDYHLLRLRQPAACLNDLDEDRVLAGNWYDAGCKLLRENFPDVIWLDEAQGLHGSGHHLGLGRLDISISEYAGITSVMVNGSFHADQRRFVQRMAEVLSATAFDLQTGESLSVH